MRNCISSCRLHHYRPPSTPAPSIALRHLLYTIKPAPVPVYISLYFFRLIFNAFSSTRWPRSLYIIAQKLSIRVCVCVLTKVAQIINAGHRDLDSSMGIKGVARNLLRGDKPGGLGDGSPPAGSRGRARWGSRRQMWIRKTNKPPI